MARVTTLPSRLGTAFLWRAIPAAVAALIITFSRNHSSLVGMSVFAGFALASCLVILVMIARVPFAGTERILFGVHAVVTGLSGVIALFALGGGLSALVLVLSVWASLTAALELYAGYRQNNRALSREWLTVGVFTAILALSISLFPVNDVYAVGLFGAYGAILAVYLVIAGVSLRSDDRASARTTEVERETSS